MKIIQCVQGSEEWRRARLGIPTASNFDMILTPKELKPSKQREKYMHRLLAEWLTGEAQDAEWGNSILDRGTELEAKARAWYEFEKDVAVEQVGLCLTDDEKVGCSPDGLVHFEGGIEIKCPMAPQCVAYLLGGKLEDDHRLQVQGALYVTGRAWWDVLAWNPYMGGFPPTLVRVTRDEEVIDKIAFAVDLFVADLAMCQAYLLNKGCVPRESYAARSVPI